MNPAVGRLAAAAVLALLPLFSPPRAAAQDAPPAGPGAAPAAPAAVPKIPARRPLPEDPPKKIAKEIQEALREFFARNPGVLSGNDNLEAKVARLGAFSKIQKGMQDWNAKLLAGDSCLRHVAWWKAALADTWPTTQPKTKVNAFDVPYQDAKAPPFPIVVNVPPGYRGKGTEVYPVLLTLIEKDADAKKVLEAVYKPLLETHIIAAVNEDKVGSDRTRALRALDWVFSSYRADHHRVALDGLGRASAMVDALGPEVAVQFNGIVFRSPATVSPWVKNLALFPCLAAVSSPVPEPVTAAVEAIRAACPDFTLVEGLGTPAADARIQEWITALPPRRIRDQTVPYEWWAGSGRNPQRWGYWFFVSQTVDAGPEFPVMVRIDRDPERNLIDIAAKNLASGVLLLNDEILDLDHPIVVHVNGLPVLTARVDRTLTHLFSNDGLYADPKWPRDFFVTAAIGFEVPEEARRTVAEREEEARQIEAARVAAEKAAREAAEKAAAEKAAAEKAAAEKAAGGGEPAPGNGGEEHPPKDDPPKDPPPAPPAPPPPAVVPTPTEAAAHIHSEKNSPDLIFLVHQRLPEGSPEDMTKRQAALEEAMADKSVADGLAKTFRISIQPQSPLPNTPADPKPPGTPADPKTAGTTADPKPPGTSADPKTAGTTADPKPPGTPADPKTAGTTADPKPPGTPADPKTAGTTEEPTATAAKGPTPETTATAIEKLKAPSLLAFRRGGVILGSFDGSSLKTEEMKGAALKWLSETLSPPPPKPPESGKTEEKAGGTPAAGVGGETPPTPKDGPKEAEEPKKEEQPAPAPAPAPPDGGK